MADIISGYEAKAKAKDEEHRRKVEAEIERRKAQEQDSSKGENVWFSRRIHDGHLYHWAIFVFGKKYELRLPSREKYKEMLPKGQLLSSAVPSFKYEARIVPWSLRDEMMQIRNASIARDGKPHAQDYYICQIGWTTLSESEVDAQCQVASSSFGVYVLGFNDCQNFLKMFARRIIHQPEGCALDYHWFSDSIETVYHKLQETAPDENIKAFQLHLQMSLVGAISGTGGVVAVAYEPEKPMQAVPQGRSDNVGNGAGAAGSAGASQPAVSKGGQQSTGGSGKTKDNKNNDDDGDCCDGGCCAGV